MTENNTQGASAMNRPEKISIDGTDYMRQDLHGVTARNGERYVMVTTEHRGVFAGYATDTDGDTITLRRGRMCTYWSKAMRGVLGLSAIGPDADCRIGPAADIRLSNVTSVTDVTDAARDRWESAPWG